MMPEPGVTEAVTDATGHGAVSADALSQMYGLTPEGAQQAAELLPDNHIEPLQPPA